MALVPRAERLPRRGPARHPLQPDRLRLLQLLLPRRRHGSDLGDEVALLALAVLQTFSEAVVLGDEAALFALSALLVLLSFEQVRITRS